MLCVLLIAITSCERRELEDVLINTAKIPVSFDWSQTGINPDNDENGDLYRGSIWLYCVDGTPFNGNSYKEYIINYPILDTIEVPVGKYKVLAINNAISDYSDNVVFKGTENWESFEYSVKWSNKSNNSYMSEPDFLAIWLLDEFEVTAEMVLESSKGLNTIKSAASLQKMVGIQVVPIIYTCTVTAHVAHLRSAKSATGVFSGFASSVVLSSGEKKSEYDGYIFSFDRHKFYDPTSKDGYMQCSFVTLGKSQESSHNNELSILFTLNETLDGSMLFPTPPNPPFRFDVSSQMGTDANRLNIEIEFGKIELPDINAEGGFEPDIDDWGDEDIIDIPINKM